MAHEIVYVDDGSDDGTWAALRAIAPAITLRRHRVGCGQSAAIVTGVRAARGHWIATLDGDGQNDPADIPALLARAESEAGLVLIAGHRTRRQDNRVKRLSSRAANRIRARLLGDHTPDTGCGLKIFTRQAFLELPAFDHMHRYLPALIIRDGGRVISVPVGHRPRLRGASKYGTWDRLWVGIFDLAGVAWLQRRWKTAGHRRGRGMIIRQDEAADVPVAGAGSMRLHLFRPAAAGRYPGVLLFSRNLPGDGADPAARGVRRRARIRGRSTGSVSRV